MNKKSGLAAMIGIVLLLIGMLASVCIGAKNIPLNEIFHAIFQYEETLNDMLVRDVRLPRMLSAVLVGGMLALAGSMTQGMLRNPVAEPSIMGVTQGATLAVAIAAIVPSIGGAMGNFLMALIGAAASGVVIMLFTMHNASNQSVARMLLAGTAISTFFVSLASVVALLGNRSQELAFWIGGGFRLAGWPQVTVLIAVGGLFTVLALMQSAKINLISLGDEVATSLGVKPDRVKLKSILYLIPICGVCVATAGNIAYVGLLVPHIIRKALGNDYRVLMPLSFLYGGVVLVYADILARMLLDPYELPVGLFTACLGVPVFLALIRRSKN